MDNMTRGLSGQLIEDQLLEDKMTKNKMEEDKVVIYRVDQWAVCSHFLPSACKSNLKPYTTQQKNAKMVMGVSLSYKVIF